MVWPPTTHGAKVQPPLVPAGFMTGWQKRATRVSLISRDGEIL
jgi:hypothetical protein